VYTGSRNGRRNFRQAETPYAALPITKRIGRNGACTRKLKDAARAQRKKCCGLLSINKRLRKGSLLPVTHYRLGLGSISLTRTRRYVHFVVSLST
jgi:hypothetical protein